MFQLRISHRSSHWVAYISTPMDHTSTGPCPDHRYWTKFYPRAGLGPSGASSLQLSVLANPVTCGKLLKSSQYGRQSPRQHGQKTLVGTNIPLQRKVERKGFRLLQNPLMPHTHRSNTGYRLRQGHRYNHRTHVTPKFVLPDRLCPLLPLPE